MGVQRSRDEGEVRGVRGLGEAAASSLARVLELESADSGGDAKTGLRATSFVLSTRDLGVARPAIGQPSASSPNPRAMPARLAAWRGVARYKVESDAEASHHSVLEKAFNVGLTRGFPARRSASAAIL